MKKKLPALTPAHLGFRNYTAVLEDQTARYVTPLYGVDEQNQRYAYGSAVLLQITEKYFLITAAHVLDENQKAHATIQVFGRNTFHSLSGPSLRSPLPASGSRDDDAYDTGVLELPNDIAQEVQAHRSFLDIVQVDHGIDYNHKQMIARNGKIEIPITPHGSSGGGLFRLGTFAQIHRGTATPTLIGIATTVKPGCLLATNIAYALALISALYPDLADTIPTSTYCKFTVEL